MAAGPGWRVSDNAFRADSADCLLENRHEFVSIAAVIEGSFRYPSTHGSAILTPGALLLGDVGNPFECDRFISFYYTREFFGHIAESFPAVRWIDFRTRRIPPFPAMVALTAAAEAESALGDVIREEEIALQLAGEVLTLLHSAGQSVRQPSLYVENRIMDALHLIEARYSEPLSIAELAR